MSKSKLKEFAEQYRKPYRPSKVERSYVYFIADGNGYIKIGVSENPNNRLATLQISSPSKLRVLLALPTQNPFTLEKRFHEHLGQYRVMGEWFDIPDSELDKIYAFYKVEPMYKTTRQIDRTFGCQQLGHEWNAERPDSVKPE